MKASILSRYILKESLAYFGISLFAFTSILLTLNMLKFASLIINKGVAFSDIVMVFISITPTFLEIALPMAALLGVMLAFARLSGDSELIVIRASGISLLELVRPVLMFGAVVGIITLFISQFARPWGYEKLAHTLFEIASSRSTAGLDEGVFSKLGDITLYAEMIDHETGALEKVLIDDRRDPARRQVVIAKHGVLLSDEASKSITFDLSEGEIHESVEDKYSVTHFVTNRISVDPEDLYSEDIAKKGKQFNSMTLSELREARAGYRELLRRIQAGEEIDLKTYEAPFGQSIAENQFNKREIKKRINRSTLEGARRFSMPFASFVLALIGMSLGVQPPRTQKTWGVGLSSLFGMAVFVLYYGVLSTGMALSESGKIPPLLALWFPNVVVLGLAWFFIKKLGIEEWHSINHAVELFIESIPRRLRRR